MHEERTTAWQVLKDFFSTKEESPPQELLVLNPLQLKIGDFAVIDAEGLFDKQLVVTEIDEYSTKVGEQIFTHTDYILAKQDGDTVTLRLNPVTNTDPYAKKHCEMLVLFPDQEMPYDEEFHKKILPTGVLEVKDGKKVIAVYERITRGNTEPFRATVKVIDQPDSPPRIEKFQYWDYVRDAGDGTQEFYFVEMDEETGWFQTFKGLPVSEEDVHLLRKKVRI